MDTRISKDHKIQFLNPSIRILKLFGLWNSEGVKLPKYVRCLLPIFVLVFCGFATGICFMSETYEAYSSGDKETAMSSLACGMTSLAVTYKAIVVLIGQKKIEECLAFLQAFANDLENRSKIRKCLWIHQWLFISGMILAFLATSSYTSLPLWMAFFDSGEEVYRRKLPITAQFLKGGLVSPWYEIIYVYQFISMNILGILLYTIDTLICFIMSLCAASIESLCDSLENLPYRDACNKNQSQTKKLTEIVKNFNGILGCISVIEDLFSFAILSHFGFNFSLLTVFLYQIASSPALSPLHTYSLIGAFGTLYMLSIYCFFGQTIPNQIEEFRKSLYCTNWYSQDKSFKQIILISLIYTENERYVIVGKLVTLSYATFAKVIKASYSLFTFLLNLRRAL